MVKEPMATSDKNKEIKEGAIAENAIGASAAPRVVMPEGVTPAPADEIVPDEMAPNGASQTATQAGDSHDSSSFMATQKSATVGPRIQVATDQNQVAHADAEIKMSTKGLNLHYGTKQALKDITTNLPQGSITALIGPSGCGKSTFLRCLNRMNDLIEGCKITGDVALDGENLYSRGVDVVNLRQRVGMVFQKPNPFPMSIFDNIAYGPRLRGLKNKAQLTDLVEESLKGAALWDEVKDDMKKSALALSGGQQQRLCIARALATKPEVVLMDEPASALDPISTLKIEELMRELRNQYTIVIVTHNMQQAARVSDYTGFFLIGELVEMDVTSKIFTDPSDQRTEDYITGRFG